MEDASVFSIQYTTFARELAAGLTPSGLLDRYLTYIRKSTLSIIRPVASESGVEFRLLATRFCLLCFLPPSGDAERVVILRICGGLLVQRRQCDRGELRFIIDDASSGVTVTLQLSDYCPLILGNRNPSRIRYWLYRLTQAAIHRLVTVRFLALLYRDMAGPDARVRVVVGRVRGGRPL